MFAETFPSNAYAYGHNNAYAYGYYAYGHNNAYAYGHNNAEYENLYVDGTENPQCYPDGQGYYADGYADGCAEEQGYYVDGCTEEQGYYADGCTEEQGYYADGYADGCDEEQGYYADDGCTEEQGYYADDGCTEEQGYYADDGCSEEQGGYYEDGCTEEQCYYADGCTEEQGYTDEKQYAYAEEQEVLPPLTISNFPKVNIHTLFIPYVDERFTEDDIRGLFTKYFIAMVKNVDFVSKTNYMTGHTQRSAYVHIKYWFFSRVASNFIQRLESSEKETRLVVNDPEYWLIFASHAKKHTENGRRLRLNMGDDSENDIPALVNVHVFDEYSAYQYEMQNCKLEAGEAGEPEYYKSGYHIFHSTAKSPMDTLYIGLVHEG